MYKKELFTKFGKLINSFIHVEICLCTGSNAVGLTGQLINIVIDFETRYKTVNMMTIVMPEIMKRIVRMNQNIKRMHKIMVKILEN